MLNKKHEEARYGLLGDNVTVLTRGLVDTAEGAILSSESALDLARRHAETQCQPNNAQQLSVRHRQIAVEWPVDKK